MSLVELHTTLFCCREGCYNFVELTDIAELNRGINEFEEMMEKINSDTSPCCVELPSVGIMCLGELIKTKCIG